jgi:hypothetical protein
VDKRQRWAGLGAGAAILMTVTWGAGAQPGSGPGGDPAPAPRLADGTPNLGRVPGEKGTWNVPYITNMAERIVEGDDLTVAERRLAQAAGPGGRGASAGAGDGARAARGGAKSEPQVPFQPWTAALYDYASAVKVA